MIYLEYLKHNRHWFLTGLETLSLGIVFTLSNNFMDRPPHSPYIVAEVNKPIYSIALIMIGIFTIVACSHRLSGKLLNVVTFMLSVVWMFYSLVFLIHDFYAPVFIPHLDTILVLAVTIRITIEALWGDKD